MSFKDMKNLDVPPRELPCPVCGKTVKPINPIRLSAEECGGKTAIIGFNCPGGCGFNSIPDDVEVLFADIVV
jgi:hypothetical protein